MELLKLMPSTPANSFWYTPSTNITHSFDDHKQYIIHSYLMIFKKGKQK